MAFQRIAIDFAVTQMKIRGIERRYKELIYQKECGINRELNLPPPLTRTQKINRMILSPCIFLKWTIKKMKERKGEKSLQDPFQKPREPSQTYEKKLEKPGYLRETWNKLPRSQRECLKSIFFHFIGILIGWGIFLFNYFFSDEFLSLLIIKCSLLSFVISLSMAFSKYLRCLILVALPMLSSTRTRNLLLTYMLLGVFNGPLRNTRANVGSTWESLKCSRRYGEKAVKVRTQESESYKFVQMVMNNTQKALNRLSEAGDKVTYKLDVAVGTMRNVAEKVKGILDLFKTFCQDSGGERYAACVNLTMKGSIPWIVGRSICVGAFPALPFLCNFNFDFPIDFSKMKDLASRFRNAYQVNVTLDSDAYNVITDESRGNLTLVFQEYVDFYYDYFDWFVYILVSNNLISYLMFFLLVFRARSYIKRFQTRDSFDNQYLTEDLLDLEMKRVKDNLPTILPLSWNQHDLFIRPWTYKMSKREYRRFILGLIFFGGVASIVIFFYILNFVVYWPMSYVTDAISKREINNPLPSIAVDVEGGGPMADFYKSMGNGSSQAAQEGYKVATECAPKPNVLDRDSFKGTLLKLGFIFMSILLEPYFLRTQHIVAGWLYPLRRITRTAWLYSYILVTKPIPGARAKAEKPMDRHSQKIPIIYKIAIANPCFRKFFSLYIGKIIFCTKCIRIGVEGDFEHFIKCATPGCSAIFCKECLAELITPCPVCNVIASFEEIIDKEVDSSDEGSMIEVRYGKKEPEAPLISQATAFSGEQFLQNVDYLIPEKTSSVTSFGSLGAVIDEEVSQMISEDSDMDQTLISP